MHATTARMLSNLYDYIALYILQQRYLLAH